MRVRGGLGPVGEWLVGDTAIQPAWLQQSHVAITAQADFMCVARGQKFLLYKETWPTSSSSEFVEIYRGAVSVLEENEEITSAIVFPLIKSSRVETKSYFTVLGFTSGMVRVFDETGFVMIQKGFDTSSVKSIKFQSIPEGKMSTNVLFTQSMQELLIVYSGMVVSISNIDLYHTLHHVQTQKSKSFNELVEQEEIINLKGLKYVIKEEVVSDCEAVILTNPTYNQYYQLTMKGGIVDDRYKPVITKPYIMTVGSDPFLQYNEKSNSSASAGELAHNVVSSVTSGIMKVASGAFGSFWGGGTSPSEPKQAPVDPQYIMAIAHSHKDSGREGDEVLISPNKMYSVIKDSQNRLILVDNYSRTIMQMWRGYHRCQMGWALAGQAKLTSNAMDDIKEVATVLVLYLPRRGLIEIWSPEQKVKVTEFQVSKNGTLLKSGYICLDDGTPHRNDPVRVFTCFLEPDQGRILHFHVPFHSLSMSSTAEKDINVQNKIYNLVESSKDDKYLDELIKLLHEIRNLHLKVATIEKLFRNDSLLLKDALELIRRLLSENFVVEDNTAKCMEHKIYMNKLTKLHQILSLYSFGFSNSQLTDDKVSSIEFVENLNISESEAVNLKKIIRESENKNQSYNCQEDMTIFEFINMCDTTGELIKSDGSKASVSLRKDIDPVARKKLSSFFCRLSQLEGAQNVMIQSGVAINEILETVLISAVKFPNRNAEWFSSISKCLLIILSTREGFDDKHISSLQELSKRILLKTWISLDLYAVILLWIHALKHARAPNMYIEDWTRRLNQTYIIVEMFECYTSLVETNDLKLNYSLHNVFDSGNGRIAEIVSTWLHKMGTCSLNLATKTEGFAETNELKLITKVADFFPKSMDNNILVIHMCWEELQSWYQTDRNSLDKLDTALMSLSSITCPKLKVLFSHMIWRTFFAKLFRDIVKLTDDFKKKTLNETSLCEKEFGIRRENVDSFLKILLGLIDKTLELLRFGELPDIHVEYDNFSLNNQKHLLDHILVVETPDIDVLSLEQQFGVVTYLTWKLKLPSRPLKMFNSVEINNLLKLNTTAVISWFNDYNTSVRSARITWISLVLETAAGYIHRLPDSQLDSSFYKQLMEPVMQLSKVWFLSDVVRVGQCHTLYMTGFDSLGVEIRNSFNTNEMDKLCEKLLDVALLRVAKYLHQDPDTAQMATIPSEVVTEVAARRDRSSTVADSSLADTLALLLWLSQNFQSEDLQLLSTQCVSAVQILQVRKSRSTT